MDLELHTLSETEKYKKISRLFRQYQKMELIVQELEAYEVYDERLRKFIVQIKQTLSKSFKETKAESIFNDSLKNINQEAAKFIKAIDYEKDLLLWRRNILIGFLSEYFKHRLSARLMGQQRYGRKGEHITNMYFLEVTEFFRVGRRTDWKLMIAFLRKRNLYPENAEHLGPVTLAQRLKRMKRYLASRNLPKKFKIAADMAKKPQAL